MSRLHYFIAIFVFAGLAFALVAQRGSCAVGPDGHFRWAKPDEWFSDSSCDVWADISPKKAVDSFEIEYHNSRVRLHQNGMASIILEKSWNDDLGVFGNALGPLEIKTEKALQSEGYTVISGQVPHETVSAATALISPMRDFAGWAPPNRTLDSHLFGGVTGTARTRIREYFDLDDQSTVFATCEDRIYDAGYGWSILHWNNASRQFGGVSSFHRIGCDSPAAVAGQQRAEEAAKMVVNALGAQDIVSRHYSRVQEPALP